jgi:hypothetical protein
MNHPIEGELYIDDPIAMNDALKEMDVKDLKCALMTVETEAFFARDARTLKILAAYLRGLIPT